MRLNRKQHNLEPAARDYGYIEYLRRSLMDTADNSKDSISRLIKLHESERDYFTASLRQVNHLIQIGKPNLELMEPKWELYKLSISFEQICKFYILILLTQESGV